MDRRRKRQLRRSKRLLREAAQKGALRTAREPGLSGCHGALLRQVEEAEKGLPAEDIGLVALRAEGTPDKARYRALVTHSPYARGGIVPGAPGVPVSIRAHGGERILPQDLVKSFDRLSYSILGWAQVARPHRSATDARSYEMRCRQAQEQTVRELKDLRRDVRRLGREVGLHVRESVDTNIRQGLRTARSLDVSEARRAARRLAGGARISRAV